MSNFKHLNLSDRIIIEQGLLEGLSFKMIAASIEKHCSTVSLEVRKHSSVLKTGGYGRRGGILGLQKTSYMQDEDALEAWAFINHISLMLRYRLFRVIKDHGFTSKYSVEDLIEYLKSITKIRIDGGEWITAEVSSKTTKLLMACDIHIT